MANSNAAGAKVLDDGNDTGTIINGKITLSGAVVHSGIQTIADGLTTTAIDLTKSAVSISSDAGGDIYTLAAGTEGQIITIVMLAANGGVGTITPVAFNGGTSVTMNAVGESAIFQYIGAAWYLLGGNASTVI